jgi:hypothetical protein
MQMSFFQHLVLNPPAVAALGIYLPHRQPDRRCGEFNSCGDRCGSDNVLKCLGHLDRHPLRPLCSKSINPRLSVYADVYFSAFGPHPPRRRRPRKCRSSSRAEGLHIMLNNCMMTIDGMDSRIPQKGVATKGNAFASHRYTGESALRYELGVDILSGNHVWIQGPYPTGKY